MATRPRATHRAPPPRQRSQKPRTRSFSDAPVSPWPVSQFIRFRRGANSMGSLWRAIVTRERLASTLCSRDDLAVLFDEGPGRGCRAGRAPASRARHSFVPFGVCTTGRLIRIGCANMTSIKLVVAPFRVAETEFCVGRALPRSSPRTGIPIARVSSISRARSGGVLQIFDNHRRFAGVAGSWPACCATCRKPDCDRSATATHVRASLLADNRRRGTGPIPAARRLHQIDHREHHGHLDQHAYDGCEGRAGVQTEQR